MKRAWFSAISMLALAACSSPPPLQTFAPLNYAYLPPIVLNVANISVVNNYQPDANAATLIAEDPAPPATTLMTVLNSRLVASGAPGDATATIEAASIEPDGANLTGIMTVRLDVSSPATRSTGYTTATVTYSQTAPDPDASQNDVQAVLYSITKQLMNQMNVQLQYQIQNNLSAWVSSTGTATPMTGAPSGTGGGVIQAAPLGAPGTAPDAVPLGAMTPNGMAPAPMTGASPTQIPPGPPTTAATPLTQGLGASPAAPSTAAPSAAPAYNPPMPAPAAPAAPAAPSATPAINPADIGQ